MDEFDKKIEDLLALVEKYISAGDKELAAKILDRINKIEDQKLEHMKQGPPPSMTAAADEDMSRTLISQMLSGLSPLMHPPQNSADLWNLLNDRCNLRIPVPDNMHQFLRQMLNEPQAALLNPVKGGHQATYAIAALLKESPPAAGKELTTTIAMFTLLRDTMTLLRDFSLIQLPLMFELNLTEKQAGSSSGAVTARCRPDTLLVFGKSTLMLGEDKAPGMMDTAIEDLKSYLQGGLGASQYGDIPGLPAYAASGLQLQFCYIARDGAVSSCGPFLDLSSPSGRLEALCCTIQCYRLLYLLSTLLPPIERRVKLWWEDERDNNTVVTLQPGGAVKVISRFVSFCRSIGSSEEVIMDAYAAASVAATDQLSRGRKPFLIRASKGPQVSNSTFSVYTTPLGYSRSIETEEDAYHLAWACLKSAGVLHKVGVVHSDFRLSNTVWLDEKNCMVIDLEHCRRAADAVPKKLRLLEWDTNTLQIVDSQFFYTATSDIYQIGRMLLSVKKDGWSSDFFSFASLLLSKKASPDHGQEPLPLEVEHALQHNWIKKREVREV